MKLSLHGDWLRSAGTMARGWLRLAAAGAIALLFLGAPPAADAQGAGGASPEVSAAIELGSAFAEVVEETLPAVVTITSERVVSGGFGSGPRGNRWPQFFDEFFRRFQPGEEQQEYRQRGLGSGFIISPDGTILTCNHVVQGAADVKVVLADRREFTAEIVGTDPKTDVAVLRVKADGPLPSLRLGDSDAMRVGEWVLALGNPFSEGLRSTVTAGIVSAKGRSRIGLTDYEDFIQTDAAINPGNSGGPLINLRGEAVGVNSAIASRSGGSQGVGFAIPIDLVRSVQRSLVDEGRVVRGWLGVYLGELTDELREAFQIDAATGVLVQQVAADSPAARAGLEDGDVILELDGAPVDDVRALRFRIAEMRPGTKVALGLLRDGGRRALTVELGELEDETRPLAQARQRGVLDALGFTVGELTREWRAELGLDDTVEGVLVTDVRRTSPAEDEGLRPGDVILEVGRQPVRSRAGLLRAAEEVAAGEVLLLTVISGDTRRFVAIRLPR